MKFAITIILKLFISVKHIEKLDTAIRVIFKTLKELLTGIYQDIRQQFYHSIDKECLITLYGYEEMLKLIQYSEKYNLK